MNNKGPTLEQVCRLAAQRGVGIRIFVQDGDVGIFPPRITIQIESRVPGSQHKAFTMDLAEGNEQLNESLGIALGEYVKKVRGTIIVPVRGVIGKA